MRWVRWQGLAAFVVIAVAVSAFWIVFVDGIIERYIEKAGTSVVGAKVELRGADLSFFPLGLTLAGLEVTDPGSPMRNAFEAERVAFLMDGVNLLLGKVTIDEMTVSGVRLNTPRESSGAVARAPRAAREAPPLVTFEIPSVGEVLEKEELESVRLASEIEKGLKEDRERLEKAVKGLPDEKRIKEYEERFERIKGRAKSPLEMVSKAQELMALRSDIEKDARLVESLAKDGEKTLRQYRQRAEQASGAPARDVKRLTEKYALTREGLANLSKVFFGGQIYAWADKLVMWRERVDRASKVFEKEPGVEVRPRGKGAVVRFPEADPTPSFLVRRAFVSVSVPSGDISGEIMDATGEQHITGRPVKFHFSGARLKGLDSMSLTGQVNRVDPKAPRDFARFDVRGYRFSGLELSGGSSLPLALGKGVVDMSADADMRDGSLDAGMRAALSGLDMSAGRPDEANEFLAAAAEAIEGVKGFSLKARASGSLDDYSLAVSSDLDRVLADSAGRVISKKAAAFEARLKEEIEAKAAGPLGELRAEMASLAAIQKELEARLGLMDSLAAEITKAIPTKGLKIPGLSF